MCQHGNSDNSASNYIKLSACFRQCFPYRGSKKRLREMGKVARWEAQSRFCSSRIIPEYEKFYERVLERAA